ncbi:S41 family peptidase [Novosphingobium aquiterrae]|uniref:S41 family peptidase n=1 Tax=Novosphingobium aquiterrae TaxID=624388 RepID=A0ABV6PH93_9SPHN
MRLATGFEALKFALGVMITTMTDRRSLLRTGAALLAAGTAAPFARAAASSTAPALDDPTIVRRALALHPGLYRYLSPRGFERRMAQFEREWTASPDLAQRFLALSRLTAAVRCGHTQCNPFNQSKAVSTALFERPTRLPFTFRWLGGRMVITGDSGAMIGIARGSVVERINGQSPQAMLDTLVRYARADGSNDAKRIAQMEMRGTEEFETFDIYQGLLFPPGAEGHRTVWREPGGSRRQALLPTITAAQRNAAHPRRDDTGPLWDWRVDADGIAVLTMPSWVTYHGNWDWQGWLTERLAALGGAKGLVIDLRENEGGTDCGTFLLERLIAKPFKPLRYDSRIAYRQTPAALRPFLDTWDASFHTLGESAKVDGHGNLVVDGDGGEDATIPAAPRIPVPTAVLIGPVNSSATFSFARRVKQAGAARLFGTATGGNLRGINGGAYFFVRLPQSGLEFDLPIKGYYPERPQADSGVNPDIMVVQTIADIAAGRDPAMTAARRYLLSR